MKKGFVGGLVGFLLLLGAMGASGGEEERTGQRCRLGDREGLVGAWSMWCPKGQGTEAHWPDLSGSGGDLRQDTAGNQTRLVEEWKSSHRDFDGSDFLRHFVSEVTRTQSQASGVSISAVDGSAFIVDQTGWLAQYADTDGTNPYKIVLTADSTDSATTKMYGYVGRVGTGETLGSEVYTQPCAVSTGAENNTANGWSAVSGGELTSGVTDPQDGAFHFGFAAKAANARAYDYLYSFCTDGTLYKCSVWVKHTGIGGTIRFGLTDGYASGSDFWAWYIDIDNTMTTWRQHTIYFTFSNDTGGSGQDSSSYRFTVWEINPSNAGEIYIDGLSIKQLTEPGPLGVIITDAPGGGTNNWTHNGAYGLNNGQDFTFNDRTMRLTIEKSVMSAVTNFTWCSWVKPDDGQPGNAEYFFTKYDYTIDLCSFAIGIGGNATGDGGKILAYMSSDGETAVGAKSTNAVFANGQETWHHVAVTKEGATCTIYFDGVAVATTAVGAGPPAVLFDSPSPLLLGAIDSLTAPDAYYNGAIEDPKFLLRALGRAEVEKIYNIGQRRFQ